MSEKKKGLPASEARLPLPLRIGNNGDYAFVRRTPADGGCGVGTYPCTHWGLDLVALPGSRVVSPVNGFVVYAVGAVPPFKGFDPAVCVIEDEDAGESHRYHLLGHLDYYQSRGFFGDNHVNGTPTRIRKPVRAGQVVGIIGGYRHTHWQVQSRPYQQGATWREITIDPKVWAKRRGAVWSAPSITPSDYIGPAVALGLTLLASKIG